jgi:WD40 repeat protein
MPSCLVLVAGLLLSPAAFGLKESLQTSADESAPLVQDGQPGKVIGRLGARSWRTGRQVTALRYTDHGKSLLAGALPASSYENTATIYAFDAGTGKPHRRWTHKLNVSYFHRGEIGANDEHIDRIEPALWSFSLDGRQVASVSDPDSTHRIEVLDVASGKLICQRTCDQHKCLYLQFAPDGKKLGLVEEHQKSKVVSVRLWELSSGREQVLLPEPAGNKDVSRFRPWFISISPDGRVLAAHGFQGEEVGIIRLWDLPGVRSRRLAGQSATEGPVVFSPDGQLLAEVSAKKLRLWNVGSGKLIKALDYPFPFTAALQFSPNGKYLVAVSHGEVQLWQVSAGKLLTTISRVNAFLFSPDSQTLATLDSESVRVFSTATLGELWARPGAFDRGDLQVHFHNALQGAGWPLAYSADGSTLVAAPAFGPLRRWEVASGKEIPTEGDNQSEAIAVAFSHDGKRLAAAGITGVVLWDVPGRKCLGRLRKPGEDPRSIPYDLLYRARPLLPLAVSFSQDGERVAAGWGDGTVTVWDTATSKLLWQCSQGELQSVRALAFLPRYGTLVSASAFGRVFWWDASTGALRRQFKDPEAPEPGYPSFPPRFGFALSPDGRSALSLHLQEGKARFWELSTGKVRFEVAVDSVYSPWSLAHSENGKYLLMDAALVDPRHGKTLRFLDAKRWSGALSPDGSYVAGAADDGTIRLWHAPTGTFLGGLAGGHAHGIGDLVFSPDGKMLASSDTDTTVLLWDLTALTAKPLPPPPGPCPGNPPSQEGRLLVHAGQKRPDVPLGAINRLGSQTFEHGRFVSTLRWLADDRTLLTGSASDKREDLVDALTTWESKTGALLHRAPVKNNRNFLGKFARGYTPSMGKEAAEMECSSWGISPDGRLLADVGAVVEPPNVEVIEIATGRVFKKLEAEMGRFSFVQLAPDGTQLAALLQGAEEPIRLFDFRQGRETGRLGLGPSDSFVASFFNISAEGKYLAAIGREPGRRGAVRIWPLGGKRLPRALADYSPCFSPLAFSADAKCLAVVTAPASTKTSRLRLYDPVSGRLLRDLGEHAEVSHGLIFSPDGKYLASLTEQRVRLWNLKCGQEQSPLPLDPSGVLLFSPDSRLLAVGTAKQLDLYDTATLKARHTFKGPFCFGPGVQNWVMSRQGLEHHTPFSSGGTESLFYAAQQGLGWPVVFSPDGKRLLAANDHGIRQWDVATGTQSIPDDAQPVAQLLALSPDGRRLAAASPGGVLLWDLGKGRQLGWLSGERIKVGQATARSRSAPTAVAFSRVGQSLAVGYASGRVDMWNAGDGQRQWCVQGHKDAVTCLQFTRDGGVLVAASAAADVVWWEAASGKRLRSVARPPGPGGKPALVPRIVPPPGPVSLSADGQLLAMGTCDAVQVVDLSSQKERWRRAFHDSLADREQYEEPSPDNGGPAPLAFSPDDRYLAYSSASGLHLADARDGNDVRFFGLEGNISSIAFSPDGTLLAAAGAGGLVLWESATGTVLARRDCHRGQAVAVAFSANGRLVYSSGVDKTILVWDVGGLTGKGRQSPLSAGQLAKLWEQLGDADAALAYKAMRQLDNYPGQAIALLRQHLKAAPSPDAEQLAGWITDLADPVYAVRARATAALEKVGESARPALRQALRKKLSLEQRRRLEAVISRLSQEPTLPPQLKLLRAVELLEMMASPEARAFLAELSRGAPEALLTEEAVVALQRLRGRGP